MRAILDHIQPLSENISSFFFAPESEFTYTAGQFIELTLSNTDLKGKAGKRWFTLSSSPTEPLLTITTRHFSKSSDFKRALFSLKPGDTVDISQPMGDFVLPKDKQTPLVFVAGGIGITPMRSMTKWLVDTNQSRPIQLIYASKLADDLVFADLFKSSEIKLTTLIDEPLTANKILELAPYNKQLYYLSGPEPMVEKITLDLTNLGLDSRRIIGDYFANYKSF